MLTTEDPAGTTEMAVYHHPGELENQAALPTEDSCEGDPGFT